MEVPSAVRLRLLPRARVFLAFLVSKRVELFEWRTGGQETWKLAGAGAGAGALGSSGQPGTSSEALTLRRAITVGARLALAYVCRSTGLTRDSGW